MPMTFTHKKKSAVTLKSGMDTKGHSTLFSYKHYTGKHEPARASNEKIKVLF